MPKFKLFGEHFKFRLGLAVIWFAINLTLFNVHADNKYYPFFSWDLFTSAESEPYFYDILFTLKSGEKIKLSRLQSRPFNRIFMWDLRNKFRVARGVCPSPADFKETISAIQAEATRNSSFEVESASLFLVNSTLADYMFKKDFLPTETECFQLF